MTILTLTVRMFWLNPDLQIVLQFITSAAVADSAFQLQNPGLILFVRVIVIHAACV
jgi:hypothetical protein